MLKITADIFSGRPNPEWVVSDAEAQTVLRNLAQHPQAATALDAGFQGLGNRGLIVESLDDHSTAEAGLPARFRLGGGASTGESFARESVERLLAAAGTEAARTHPSITAAGVDQLPFTAELGKYILDTLPSPLAAPQTQAPAPESGSAPELTGASLSCFYETTAFNPGFWNDSAHISKNNCYNYATNRRTDTFAQPGRACGHMYAHINCTEVCNGALCDGATLSCAPDSQKPRWYMALVIAPGPGFIDYHWYRKATEPFWGHKPGGTAARNYDNSNHVVTDPRTANRGPYTIFCGFVYAQARMVVK